MCVLRAWVKWWPHRLTHGSALRRALDTVPRSHGGADLSCQTGVTRAGIYKALGEDGNPSFETIRSILDAMELRLTVEPV
jgi:probable addiction module antidote protein